MSSKENSKPHFIVQLPFGPNLWLEMNGLVDTFPCQVVWIECQIGGLIEAIEHVKVNAVTQRRALS